MMTAAAEVGEGVTRSFAVCLPVADGRVETRWANEELWLRRTFCFYAEVAEKWPMKGESNSVRQDTVVSFATSALLEIHCSHTTHKEFRYLLILVSFQKVKRMLTSGSCCNV
jgi:hypothetical protein